LERLRVFLFSRFPFPVTDPLFFFSDPRLQARRPLSSAVVTSQEQDPSEFPVFPGFSFSSEDFFNGNVVPTPAAIAPIAGTSAHV